ncbi:unnamed protein product [Mytilus coruscus]|uniref:CCHC-type domain-containing protein n=1 Tax=Mytilus coruscus TaxID=42192 RepID=A0A6J8CLH6_MYTCO|nr:unnamed protein product [Mytilus coruscus]
MWGGFGGSSNWKNGSFSSSTPMSDMNQRQQNAITAGTDHKWKKFVLRWIWFILSLILVIGWFSVTFPFHDNVCWLKQNVILFVVTLLITFPVSVIVKLFIDETSGRFKHFENQNEDRRRPTDTVRQKLNFDQNIPHIRDNAKTVTVNSSSPLQDNRSKVQVKRTFSGSSDDVLADFLRYFENIATLNAWNEERKRLVFFTTLRGRAETFVHGLPSDIQMRWESLKNKMELRFGHSNMKESYLAEAKLRRRKPGESFRDLGQSIEDLYRRAYTSHPELVQENSIRSFLDACGESEEFRMFIRRTMSKTLQEAVSSAMQEECIRMNEGNVNKVNRRNNVYTVEKESDVHEPNLKKNSYSESHMNNQGYKNKRNRQCTNCGKRGHTREYCWILNIGNSVEVEDENEDVCDIVEHRNSSNKMFPQCMEKMYQNGIQNLSIKEADEFKRVFLQNGSEFADPDGKTGHTSTLLGMHEIKLQKQTPIKEPQDISLNKILETPGNYFNNTLDTRFVTASGGDLKVLGSAVITLLCMLERTCNIDLS